MDKQEQELQFGGNNLSWGTPGNTIQSRIDTYNMIRERVRILNAKRGIGTAVNRTIEQINSDRKFS